MALTLLFGPVIFQVRVLEVVPGSPSHIAGLKPEDDYLLGTAERVFKDPNILLDEVTAHLDQPMAFYVYNTKTDEVRDSLICVGPTRHPLNQEATRLSL